MPEPIFSLGQPPIAADGVSFSVHEWSGSGPDYLHLHEADDEAWHILSGALVFRFLDREVIAPAGSTVFVPAGVAHTYAEADGPCRYLMLLTPRLRGLIAALHAAPYAEHAAVLRQYQSRLVE